ncbi:MAG: BlaI/MecI/CopY family transcriptional regulator [Myxococcota bacterium]
MFKNIRLRPEKSGTQVALYDLEADIMDEVWSRDWDTFSVRDMLEILQDDREIAYTTVMTTVKRLFDKGLLEREKDGRRFLYTPVIGREEFYAQMAVQVMRSLPASGREAAMSMLIDEMDGAESLDRLEELIAAKKRDDETDE